MNLQQEFEVYLTVNGSDELGTVLRRVMRLLLTICDYLSSLSLHLERFEMLNLMSD